MPIGDAVKDSPFFTPLSYYKLTVPVVGLPRGLNDEAKRVGSEFVREAAQKHGRFLVLAYRPSFPTEQWLKKIAAASYDWKAISQPFGILILEFTPRRANSQQSQPASGSIPSPIQSVAASR
jgi:hypothetical protein